MYAVNLCLHTMSCSFVFWGDVYLCSITNGYTVYLQDEHVLMIWIDSDVGIQYFISSWLFSWICI